MYSLEAIFVMYCDVASHFHKIYFKSYEARQNIELACTSTLPNIACAEFAGFELYNSRTGNNLKKLYIYGYVFSLCFKSCDITYIYCY